MGGSVALTIRISETKEYRGSCWTNILPYGLWAAPFYADLDTSRRHAESWLDKLLAHREADPELEDLWGGHDKLAPLGYGLVLVDYVSSTLISTQGYAWPDRIIRFGPPPSCSERDRDPDLNEKWAALEAAGLLGASEDHGDMVIRQIKLPFETVIVGNESAITPSLEERCDGLFGLSADERSAWARWYAGSRGVDAP
jgi:hypothetical protein